MEENKLIVVEQIVHEPVEEPRPAVPRPEIAVDRPQEMNLDKIEFSVEMPNFNHTYQKKLSSREASILSNDKMK